MSVTFKIYSSDGTTPVYTFPCVFEANYPHIENKYIEHQNVRSKGSIIVDGGQSAWDLVIRGVITSTDYDSLMTLVNAMESTIAQNTAYYIKISSGTTTHSYKCKRIAPIEWEAGNLRTNYTEYTCTLRVLSW